MPVAVLHASPDNDWLYVRARSLRPIPAVNVAFGSTGQSEVCECEDFIVALDHKVHFADRGFNIYITDFTWRAETRENRFRYQVIVPVGKATAQSNPPAPGEAGRQGERRVPGV